VVLPLHPRTRARLLALGREPGPGIAVCEPLGYLDFLALEQACTAVVTDSGGIQEETTCLGVPCLTLRCNTERPVTVTMGTNTLIGWDMDLLLTHVDAVLAGRGKHGRVPPLWEGQAARRIARALGVWRDGGKTSPMAGAGPD